MALPQTARTVIGISLLLVGVFALGVLGVAHTSLSEPEGLTLWALRDSTVGPAEFPGWLRHTRQSVTTALSRVRALDEPPLYFALLAGWKQVAGDSLLAARLPSAWWGLLLLALAYRLAHQFISRRAGFMALALLIASPFYVTYMREAVPHSSLWLLLLGMAALIAVYYLNRRNLVQTHWAALIVLLVVALQIALYRPLAPARHDWQTPVNWLSAARQPTEPAILNVPPSSPPAHYLALTRQGVTLDVGWRDQTPEDMPTYAAALDGAPVIWAVLPVDADTTPALLRALADYVVSEQRTHGGLGFYRLERRTDRPYPPAVSLRYNPG